MNPNLENFRPKLRAGRVIPQGSRIIFETDNPYNQVVLPMSLADMILLCSGKFSVREIIAKIYKKQGAVPFKSILRAIHVLHQGGFFENGDELVLSSDLQSWMDSKRSRMSLSWRFGQRIVADKSWPLVYYAVTLLILLSSISGLQLFPSSPFEIIDLWISAQAGWVGFLKLFMCSSLVLSLRFLVRGWQQLLITGKAYNVSVKLAPWGVHLHVGNEANDLFENRLYTAMFYVSQILMPWMFIYVFSFGIERNWLEPLTIVAMFSTLWQLNPFVNSDGLKLIQALLLPSDGDVASWHFERNQLIDSITPMQKRVDQDFARICSIWGGIWLVISFAIMHEAAIRLGPRLPHLLSFKNGPSIFALLGLVGWLFALYLLVKCLVETVAISLVRPHWRWINGRIQQWYVHSTPDWGTAKVTGRIELLPLFSHFHEEFLTKIITHSQVLEYRDRAVIVRQDESSNDIFVLLEGQVMVSRKVNGESEVLSELNPVSVFGEAALVDDLPRTTQIVAKGKIVVLKVPVSVLREVALEAQSVRHLEDFRNAILVNQFFASSPVFRSLTTESIEFLCSRGTLEYFDLQQLVFNQGDSGDSLYLILRGGVEVVVHGTVVKRLKQGSFFGEIALIASIPRTATIQTIEPCVFFKISSDSFWEILVQHLDLGVFLESVSESRLKEDLELAPLAPTGSDS